MQHLKVLLILKDQNVSNFNFLLESLFKLWPFGQNDLVTFILPLIMKSACKSLQLSFDLTQTLQNGRLFANDHDTRIEIALLERFTIHLAQLRGSAIQIMIIMNPQRSLPRDFWGVGTTNALISMFFLIGFESLSRFEEHFCGLSELVSE